MGVSKLLSHTPAETIELAAINKHFKREMVNFYKPQPSTSRQMPVKTNEIARYKFNKPDK